MANLFDQLKGVNVDPPTTDPDNVEPGDGPEPNPDTNEPDGRTIDNVRGELLRKQEKSFSELSNMIRSLQSEIQTLRSAPKQDAPKTSIYDYTVAELEALASQVPEESKAEFHAILAAKRETERMSRQIFSSQSQSRIETERERYNERALERYPDLADGTSEIARRVEAALSGIADAVVQQNPRLVYDLANTAAVELEIKPKAPTRKAPKTAPSNTEPGPKDKKTKTYLTDERRATIAKSLQNALPKGKKFNLEQIKANEEFYSDKLQDHTR